MNRITCLMTAAALGLGACATAPDRTNAVVSEPPPYYRSAQCSNCGTVDRIETREVAGRPNVGGAVVGAIIGGVVGHQFGEGRGNTAATAGGAVAGGAIGSQVGKDERAIVYEMGIQMDNGDYRNLTVADPGQLRPGDRLRIEGDHVVPM